MSARAGAALVAAALMAMLAIGFWRLRPDQTVFRRALPPDASDVREWRNEDSLLPDYAYHLRARVTEPGFRRYVERLRLEPHAAGRRYSEPADPWLGWAAAPGFSGDWWTPSSSLAGTFVRQEGRSWTFAKREGGYVYLTSLRH